MKLHEIQGATARQLLPSSSSFVPYMIPIHEDEHDEEDEKNQIRSHAYAPASAG
jgi:hypothetical protein